MCVCVCVCTVREVLSPSDFHSKAEKGKKNYKVRAEQTGWKPVREEGRLLGSQVEILKHTLDCFIHLFHQHFSKDYYTLQPS